MLTIEKLRRNYRDFCVVCGNWEELAYRDYTLGQQSLCPDCLIAVCEADEQLFKSGLKEPPTYLIYSKEHKLFQQSL